MLTYYNSTDSAVRAIVRYLLNLIKLSRDILYKEFVREIRRLEFKFPIYRLKFL